jgi:HAD superfamily hydrolase (TIGR01662 family)
MVEQRGTCYVIKGAAGTAKSKKAIKLTGDEAYVCAADDFPGIYDKNGVYQKVHQEASHKWTLVKLEGLLKQGIPDVAYANTSMKKVFYWDAVELALRYGYAVDVSLCEGVILPNKTPIKSVHNVPYGAISRQLTSYEPFVYPVKHPFQKFPNDRRNKIVKPGRKLQVFDRDNTLITSRDGNYPTKGNILLLPGVRGAIARMKQKGDHIVVASNQAGVGQGHKSEADLFEETLELSELLPQISTVLYCPDFDGETLLVWEKGKTLKEFERHDHSQFPSWQPFRKPAAGMLEALMEIFATKFVDANMFGNGPEDSMCASAAGFNYRHIHELLVDQWRYENCGG